MAGNEDLEVYPIGAEVWFRGDPGRIVSEPYEAAGAEWQDAERIGGASRFTVRTPRSARALLAERLAEEERLQAGFRRLKATQRSGTLPAADPNENDEEG